MCAQTVAEQANMDAIAAEKSMIEAERSKLTVTEPDLEEFRTVCQSIYPEFEEIWGQGLRIRFRSSRSRNSAGYFALSLKCRKDDACLKKWIYLKNILR